MSDGHVHGRDRAGQIPVVESAAIWVASVLNSVISCGVERGDLRAVNIALMGR